MSEYRNILTNIGGAVAYLTLNRVGLRNAMNPEMIVEITSALQQFNNDQNLRVVIIRGNGSCFCAGGDLNWMRDVLGQTREEIQAESRHLLQVYRVINESPEVVISALEGSVIAGGLGLAAISDVVIAEEKTKFCFSEVKIGLVPGIIAAFLLPRIGPSWMRYLSKTAIFFDCDTARTIGLIHEIAQDVHDLEDRIAMHVRLALDASPAAIERTNALISDLGCTLSEKNLDTALTYNADARLSDEAQEGISAFLDKRHPDWALYEN